jgi:hypothetical protein
MKIMLAFLILCSLCASAEDKTTENTAANLTTPQGEPAFLDKYPHLKENLYKEPESGFQLGLSAGVLGVVGNNMFFSLNFFQVHYVSDYWDNELFSVAFGSTSASSPYLQSNRFLFRTIPKYRWSKTVSLGVVAGYEFVSFPNITSTIYKSGLTTQPEPFSSAGPIYGLAVSENFKTDSGTQIKVTEVAYQETYSVTDAGSGWSYLYASPTLRASTSTIQAGAVVSIEVGFYY